MSLASRKPDEPQRRAPRSRGATEQEQQRGARDRHASTKGSPIKRSDRAAEVRQTGLEAASTKGSPIKRSDP